MPYLDSFEHAGRVRIRERFLDVAVKVEPELLRALGHVVPSARKAWRLPTTGVIPLPPLPPEEPALPELEQWAVRFQLHGSTDDWVLRAATMTLVQWLVGGTTTGITMASTSSRSKPLEPFRFSFELTHQGITEEGCIVPGFGGRAWHPMVQPWSDFRRDVEQEVGRRLRTALRAYRSNQEGVLAEAGWKRIPAKHQPQHLRWMALYQIRGMSFAAIARQELRSTGDSNDPKRRIIEAAVRSTAVLLGLRLRPARRGRTRAGDCGAPG